MVSHSIINSLYITQNHNIVLVCRSSFITKLGLDLPPNILLIANFIFGG